MDLDHQRALCADSDLQRTGKRELGDFVSAQMTAVEVQGDNLTVKSTGGSTALEGGDKVIACGNKCVAAYVASTAVALSAKADSGSSFAGWSGACSGTQTTCTVTVRCAIANRQLVPGPRPRQAVVAAAVMGSP